MHDLPSELKRGRFDLVYTAEGVLAWLHDLDAWAGGIVAALRSGGDFLLHEEHPVAQCVDASLRWREDYFDEDLHVYQGWSHFELKGPPATEEKVERFWRLGQVVTALARAGLVVRQLEEYPGHDLVAPASVARPRQLHRLGQKALVSKRYAREQSARWASQSVLILVAFGAILTWAVDADVNGLNVTAVGVILMIVGILVVVLDLLWWRSWTWYAAGPAGRGGRTSVTRAVRRCRLRAGAWSSTRRSVGRPQAAAALTMIIISGS